MEEWKDIPEHEDNYQINMVGEIRNKKTNRILKAGLNNGYKIVSLSKNNKKQTKTIHKLMAITFLNHKPSGFKEVVDHINHIRTDNRLENLRLVTARENTSQKHLKSTSKYIGVSWHKSKQKWVSNIYIKNEKKYLGYFDTEIEAHNAYQEALIKLKNK